MWPLGKMSRRSVARGPPVLWNTTLISRYPSGPFAPASGKYLPNKHPTISNTSNTQDQIRFKIKNQQELDDAGQNRSCWNDPYSAAKFWIAAFSDPASCRTGPIRQLPGSDRSETQSFSIGWSNILPVIWPTINKKVSTLADLKLHYDLKFGHWLPLS